MSDRPTGSNPERRARLLGLQLHAVVREHLATAGADGPELVSGPFALGAALRAGDDTWVLLDGAAEDGRGLGPALLHASRTGAGAVNVVTTEGSGQGAGVMARRATAFAFGVTVWQLDGRTLRRAQPAPVEPPRAPKPAHLAHASDIEAAGAAVVVEHGVVAGEVRGLEVCRVVDVEGDVDVNLGIDGSAASGPAAVPATRLDVGVGVQDREAFAVIHAGVPTADALAKVVSAVAAVRTVDVPAHPLNRLAPERFVRWRLEQEPWLVGMATVRPATPPVPRRNLKDRAACTLRGQRIDGGEVVIVCSVGVDLDVIPYAADARLGAEVEPGVGSAGVGGGPDTPIETIVVMPARDLVRATRELADLLRQPLSLLALPAT